MRQIYAFYLYEVANNKQRAIEQMVSVEQYGSLAMDQEYKIYRLKKIVEEDVEDAKMDEANEVYKQYRKGDFLKKIRMKMERLTLLHMELWNNFLQDYPDCYKAITIGRV